MKGGGERRPGSGSEGDEVDDKFDNISEGASSGSGSEHTNSRRESEVGSDGEDMAGVLMRDTDRRAMSRSIQKLLVKAQDGSAKAFEEGRKKRLRAHEDQEEEEAVQKAEARKARHSLARQWHVVPTITTDLELERNLRRTATKGVVTLFNAKSKHQKKAAAVEGDKSAGRATSASLGKGKFFEMLRGEASQKPEKNSKKNREATDPDLEETITGNGSPDSDEGGVSDDEESSRDESGRS